MINSLAVLQRFRHRHRVKRLLRTASQTLELGLDSQIYLKGFLKSGVSPDSVPLSAMTIDFFSDRTYRSFFYVYCACRYDASFYFTLAYQDPKGNRWGLALLGFRINSWIRTVFVEQIQGIHLSVVRFPQKEELLNKLGSFRWEKMLVKVVEDWAMINGFSRVGIRQASFNKWRRQGQYLCADDIQHNERLRMRYDITARRMGYKTSRSRGLFNGYHYKKINTPRSKLRGIRRV